MKKLITLSLTLLCLNSFCFSQAINEFKNPKDDYKPWIFWDWINDMVSKKGITSDLSQFKKFGVGGTLIMLVGSETSGRQMWATHHMPNPIVSQTPEFFDAWKFAAEESSRLGLTISSQLGTGWCHSGGPWVKPAQAVQHVTYTETEKINGSLKKINIILGNTDGTSSGDAFHSKIMTEDKPQWVQIELPHKANINEVVLYPFQNKKKVDFGFPKQFIIETANNADFSDAQVFYKTNGDFPAPETKPVSLKGKATGKYIRIKSIKNYFTTRGGKNSYLLSLARVEVLENNHNIAVHAPVTSSSTIDLYGYSLKAITDDYNAVSRQQLGNTFTLDHPGGQYFTSDIAVVAYRDGDVVKPEDIIDLTGKFVNNKLAWNVPAGNWIIRRYAIRDAQAYTRPAPVGGKGLECDKLDKDAVDANFAGMVGRYIKNSPNLAGKTIRAFEADSWEVGNPEWSGKFKEEFKKLRGYDPTPWLIAYKSSQVVGNADLTERFKNDMYLTQTDLFATNFFTHLANKADSLGMEFMTEPYTAPFDPVRMAGRVQVPMCEFWASGEMMYTARWASSAANTYGKNRVASEAFTGRWNDGNWTMDPYAIKRVGDLAFCNGVNKMILHGTALQPWGSDQKPGMNMFFWGTMFVPGQTWWGPARAWTNYLTRCQYMLTRGKNVADVVGLMPTLDWWETLPVGLHKKYNYDLVTEELLLKDMEYTDGYFCLPSGAKYRVLFLPKRNTKMKPEIIAKLIALVKKGGTVVCENKPTQSPSLSNHFEADKQVKSLAAELWGNADGKTVFENKLGAGKLLWLKEIWKDNFDPERNYFLSNRTKGYEFYGNTAQTNTWSADFLKVLQAKDLPDVEVLQASGTAMAWGGRPETTVGTKVGENAIAWIHRRDAATDIYFVSSQVAEDNKAELLFRVKDKVPFILDPQSGKPYNVKEWSQQGDRVKMTIPFESFGSVFVVFKPKTDLLAANEYYKSEKFETAIPLTDKWEVSFPAKLGAPEKAELSEGSLTNSDVFGIKYFSGTASYQTSVNLSYKQIKLGMWLDLGTVKNLAEVVVNDKVVDTLWKPPFRADIAQYLVPGNNKIVVKVTNTWWNRMVGDQQLPEDLEWMPNLNFAGNDYRGYELKNFPAWVWNGEQRPSKDRVSFTPWRYVEKDSSLQQSGLIGPVRLLNAK